MDNYIKMFGTLVSFSGAEQAFNFDYTEEDADVTMEGFRAFYTPNDTFQFFGPAACYLKLNKSNFGQILNAARSLGFQGLVDLKFMTIDDSPRGDWNSNQKDFHSLAKESASKTPNKPQSKAQKGGSATITLLNYLLLLQNTWKTGATGQVPQRWQEWLALLISHFGRYTPTQIYAFLARVDFSAATFAV